MELLLGVGNAVTQSHVTCNYQMELSSAGTPKRIVKSIGIPQDLFAAWFADIQLTNHVRTAVPIV
jgi:hypothetical protein